MTTSPLKGIDMGPTTGCGSNTTFSPLEVHPSCPRRRLTRAPPPEVTTAHPPRPAYPGRRLWSQRRVAGAGGSRGGGAKVPGGRGRREWSRRHVPGRKGRGAAAGRSAGGRRGEERGGEERRGSSQSHGWTRAGRGERRSAGSTARTPGRVEGRAIGFPDLTRPSRKGTHCCRAGCDLCT